MALIFVPSLFSVRYTIASSFCCWLVILTLFLQFCVYRSVDKNPRLHLSFYDRDEVRFAFVCFRLNGVVKEGKHVIFACNFSLSRECFIHVVLFAFVLDDGDILLVSLSLYVTRFIPSRLFSSKFSLCFSFVV